MTRRIAAIAAATLLLLNLSCAGSSGRSSINNTYSSEAGSATGHDLKEKANFVFAKLNYQFERFEQFQTRIYLETFWRDRTPFPDEAAIGAQIARTRFILRARERVSKSDSELSVYKVRITGENEVKFNEDDGWVRLPLTAAAEEYIRSCISEYRSEINSGIRVY